MDTSALLKSVLSSANLSDIVKTSGSSEKDVSSVLTSALPALAKNLKLTDSETKEVSKETGVDVNQIAKIITAALPTIKEALKDVDLNDVLKNVKAEDITKAASALSGLLGKKK